MLNTLIFWLRWSWRDLRERWLQVTVIALIVALGTAIYAGLGSTTPWRLHATEASYTALNMYDLRVQFPTATYVEQDQLAQTIATIPHSEWITAAEPRLITGTFVNVPTAEGDILVRGKLYGINVANGGPHVNGFYVNRGRALTSTDHTAALLEYHFADHYDLPTTGTLHLNGDTTLEYVGHAMTPDYFMVTTEDGGMWAQANFAAVFTTLETAQEITAHPGLINDYLLTTTDDANLDLLTSEIDAALTATLPDTGFTIKRTQDNAVYRLMFQAIDMNQQVYDLMIALFLAGASFGAFNLASRMVEAQRRQIGIGMALGIPPRQLIVRPLLAGSQIAILGAILGLIFGLLVGKLAEVWMLTIIPLPVMGRLFQVRTFLEAAALGFVLPFAATIYPVWRAVQVLPVEAIRTGHLIENNKGKGLAPALAGLPLPGRSFMHIPVRNLLRSPRRTLLTTLGIAVAITTLIGLTGMLDSVNLTLDHIRREYYQDHPDRLTVFLDSIYPVDSAQVAALRAAPELAATTTAIRVPGKATHGDITFNVLIETLTFGNEVWTPTVTEGEVPATPAETPGVLIAKNAAADLGIGIGDTFTLEHPRRTGLLSYQIVTTDVQVTGYHADPWRTFMLMNTDSAAIMGISGMTNMVEVIPQPGLDQRTVKNALFGYDGVASVIATKEIIASSESVLVEVVRFLAAVKLAVLALAFLIAFSSTNINMNERAREIATMFAFGLRIRTITRMTMLENLLTGLVGTLLGIIMGSGVLTWMLHIRMLEITPEIYYPITISPTTLVIAIVIGIGVTTLTPLLFMRRMLEMDIPSTLRVME